MMTFFLAQSDDASTFSNAGVNPVPVFDKVLRVHMDILNHPEQMVSALRDIHPVWGGIFIVMGALCVLNGSRWHKALILILAAMVGVGAGQWLGRRIGDGQIAAGVSLAVLFSIAALPGLRFAAALFGGVVGAFAGANIWTACGFNPENHHLGSVVGLITLAMLAFIAFRTVIVIFTSIGGATLLVLGALALLLRVDTWNDAILRSINSNHLIIPLLVAVTAAVSAVIQQGGGFKGLYACADRCAAKKQAPKPA